MSFSRYHGVISFRILLVFLFSVVCGGVAISDEKESLGMPNAEILSAYANGSEILYNFRDGKLEYRFVAGRMKGAFAKNLDFVSRRIDDEVYLVSWHDTNNANYMTILFDMKNNKEYFTSVMGYANETPQTNFLEADIVKVTLLN